jgi:hypothetical protein
LQALATFKDPPTVYKERFVSLYLNYVNVKVVGETQDQYSNIPENLRVKLPCYPPGSVLVQANVCYNVIVDSDEVTEASNYSGQVFYTFQGCISGHTELDWIIISQRSVDKQMK